MEPYENVTAFCHGGELKSARSFTGYSQPEREGRGCRTRNSGHGTRETEKLFHQEGAAGSCSILWL